MGRVNEIYEYMGKTRNSQPIRAYDQAVKYLSLRIHTAFELRIKLKRKKFESGDIEDALQRLIELKYINDEDFARVFVQNLIKYKTFGYYGIKNKLRQRGIEDRVTNEILEEELDIEAEMKIAIRAVRKSSKKEKIKLMQMLARKGFRSQVISAVVGQFSEE